MWLQAPAFSLNALSARSFMLGTLAAFVGVASSFAVVLQGLTAAGATTEQAASGLMALSLSMGLCAIVLSIRSRLPISVAWSTPGAALLASTTFDGGFGVAVGAFIVCALLLMASGLLPWLGRAVSRIPVSLASAMLAGILFTLCLAPARAIAETPLHGLLLLVAWAVGGMVHRLLAIPAALAVFVVITLTGSDLSAWSSAEFEWLPIEWVSPVFTWQGMIGIALPLFIVTTASQNIPGIAVLKSCGYTPAAGPLFATTGLFSLLSAPFGGHAVNLAAITAALCAGEEAHANPQRRYWASIINGLWYVLFGIAAGAVTLFVSLAPTQLLESVAGLALIGSFAAAAVAAFTPPQSREAAAVTFFITASGLSFGGISGAFWGLIAGVLIHGMTVWRHERAD
ncbi:MAG: benzoate/H(+) symporter BenE family transporter [Gammaproteobacteria bacterium]|nr:benzoate/H(+) symporter BenE family transporter [Gammaproteobacteria bacterium]